MILTRPTCYESSKKKWNSFCFCLTQVLPYLKLESDLSYEEIMGYTAHAFHHNIQVETVNKWGPTMYDWNGLIPLGLNNLGIKARFVSYSGFHPGVPNVQEAAVHLVRESINEGRPLIMWEPLHAEFGIIYGYDDEQKLLYVMDRQAEGQIPYEAVGRGKETPELYVLALEKRKDLTPISNLKGTLELILKYGLKDGHDYWEFATGLPAYEAWIQILEQKKIDVFGNAYNARFIKHARETAVSFLEIVHGEIKDGQQKALFSSSREQYQQVVGFYQALEELFPYPHGGTPYTDQKVEMGIELLRKIKYHEELALKALKEVYETM